MAAYVPKYATKSADASGTLDHALYCRPGQGRGATLLPHGTPLPCTTCNGTGQPRPLPRLAVARHAPQMIRTCWELGKLPEFADHLKLRKRAHMLGFPGPLLHQILFLLHHLGALRDARRTWRTEQARAKKLARLTTRDVRTFLDGLRTTCPCCAHERDAARRVCCAIGQCCEKRPSPLTVTYVHTVLKSALEHAVREDGLPRNVARNVKTTTPRPRRFQPLAATEARQLPQAANGDRLHALYELALRTRLRKGELLGLHWEDLDLDSGNG